MSVSGYQLLDLTGRLKDVNTGLGDLCRGFEIANAPGADAKTFTLRETGYNATSWRGTKAATVTAPENTVSKYW